MKTWADDLVDRQAQQVIQAPWPKAEQAGAGVFKNEAPRVRIEVLDPARRLEQPAVAELPALETGLPFDKKGNTLPRSRHAGRRRCAARRPARVRLRRRRRRAIRQRVPAAAAVAERVRRSHPQLAAGRRRRAWRVRGRRAGRAAADWRDAVQRFRRDRLQSARQQRREDPLPVGRQRADGGPHAVGRLALRGSVPQPEHRAVVLSHARPEDRRALDAGRRAGADGGGRRRSGSGAVLRAHRALPRSAHQADPARGRAGAAARSEKQRYGGQAPTSR